MTSVARRVDQRHDARPYRIGQRRPSVDQGLQVGREVRRFRFNCPRICPRIRRNGRFSNVFGGLPVTFNP
jgi:hypothetical protein